MVQGTGLSVGKSLLVTAPCRIFKQGGYRVAPFKAQNMSLNSYVTSDGAEVGRAQAVQADAAEVPVMAEMNPVLLKPEIDYRSQIVVMGRPMGTLDSSDFGSSKGIPMGGSWPGPWTGSGPNTTLWSSRGPGVQRKSTSDGATS